MHHQLVRCTEGEQIAPSIKKNRNRLDVDPNNNRGRDPKNDKLKSGYYYYYYYYPVKKILSYQL